MDIFLEWIYENSLYLILGVATVLSFLVLRRFKHRLQINEGAAAVLALVHTVIGVLCVKVFAFLESGEAGGMSLYGAVFFLPVVYTVGAKVTKRKPADVFDVFAVCVIVTLMCARVNCILSGCCLGSQISYRTELRWPTREAEILFYILLLLWLFKKMDKAQWSGTIYPLYMMLYGAFRFVVEFFRVSQQELGIFHISHIWSLVSLIVGASIYMEIQSRHKETRKRRR